MNRGTRHNNIQYLAFSDRGYALADRLAQALGGQASRSGEMTDQTDSLTAARWTKAHFAHADALVFVGAAGIAVRSIAPYLQDKSQDPAVVVLDERALHVIPLLSGHLGGANDLARVIAGITGADPVITTATDLGGIFAVDAWARRQGLVLVEKERIVKISSRLLVGQQVTLCSRWPIAGKVPDGVQVIVNEEEPQGLGDRVSHERADILLDSRADQSDALHLLPRIYHLGIGCRRGTAQESLERHLTRFLQEAGVHPGAICDAATIDLKQSEAGLLAFCATHAWPLQVYSAEDLRKVEGNFTASSFVSEVTGVDNVCERSAVLASGGGSLLVRKTAGDGVTMALAAEDFHPSWEWKHE